MLCEHFRFRRFGKYVLYILNNGLCGFVVIYQHAQLDNLRGNVYTARESKTIRRLCSGISFLSEKRIVDICFFFYPVQKISSSRHTSANNGIRNLINGLLNKFLWNRNITLTQRQCSVVVKYLSTECFRVSNTIYVYIWVGGALSAIKEQKVLRKSI